MRLMYITRSISGGGAERVTTHLANHHADQGHEVHLVVFSRSLSEYDVNDNVQIHRMPDGVMRKIRALRALVRDAVPELVISLGSKYNYLVAAGLLRSNRVVLSERNYPPSFYRNPVVAAFVRSCYRHAAGVVFQTEEVFRMYQYSIRGSSRVIANPVMQGLPQWKAEERSRTIVSFGRLEKQKNFPLLIEAFSLIHDEYPEYSLKIYGDGSQKGSLLQQIHELGLNGSIEVLPFSDSIHSVLATAAFFVMASDYEGMPNSLLEAMSMGVPVVSVDSLGGAAHELLRNNERGLLVPRGDIQKLADSMRLLIDSEETAIAISHAAKAVRLELSEDAIGAQWIDLYLAICGEVSESRGENA